MKRILALTVAGVMMVSSSLCVFAAETDSTGETTESAESTETGSKSITTEDLLKEIEKLTEQIAKDDASNQKTIAALTKQVQSLTNAVKASNSSKSSKSSGGSGSGGRSSQSSSANEFYKRNNIIGYGSNVVGQGGHVEINGGKSNVTFVLTPATNGQLTSATSLAASVSGALLNVVTTSSPGASFATAKVNFYVSGVTAGDNIAVYQLQNNKWVQLSTAEIRKDHVVVNMTRHGTVAFVRVPVLASATN